MTTDDAAQQHDLAEKLSAAEPGKPPVVWSGWIVINKRGLSKQLHFEGLSRAFADQMPVHGWAVDTTTILRVHVICAGSAPPFLVFTPDFSFLAMNPMPVIPRTFLLIIFIRLSQLFPYVTLPPDLTSSLLCIPNYDHVCVILDALRISYHASEVSDCFIDDGVINHVRRVIKQYVQVV